MKKIDLIGLVSNKAHLPKKASREAIETFLGEVQKALSKGEKVVLSGFGTFKSVLKGILFDFGYFIRAAENLRNNINPYLAENFVYPPPVLFLYFPFLKIPLVPRQVIWFLLSLLALLA